MDQLDDEKIIDAVIRGDVNAYGILIKRYQKPIFNLMYRMTRSHEDALDLAQETFIKVYEKLDRFKPGARFFPWLYTIGLNHARNFVRKGKVEVPFLCENSEDGAAMTWSAKNQEELPNVLNFNHLYEALQQLPLEHREALILHYREGFSMEEIAEAFQLSVSGAKMRVHRGVTKLREIILGDDDEREST